ncbi:hypothetical protein HDU86_004915 [Geranomyces michiganensis]|nr:hypothetical protein HDU86_004915 [Geranomyces michiganensis]
MILFVRPRDTSREIWDGPRAGLEGAKRYFGADEAREIDTLPAYINSLASSPAGPVYTDLSLGPKLSSRDSSITSMLRNSILGSSGQHTAAFEPLKPLLNDLRLSKSPAETAVMRQAGRITGRAFVDMMKATKPGVGEHDLWAVAEHSVKRRGASRLAYVPVVAGGKNALTIHYVLNDQLLDDGTMVLVDAGGEYGGYASDVTRTWPVNGKFSKEQRALYNAVLRVQRTCIAKCSGDAAVSLDDLQREAFELLRGECSTLFGRTLSNKEMNRLYPHHVGHWLGLDVHDTQSVHRTTRLQPGMVVTIEPALYIPDSPDFPEAYRGIGVRIEDDVVVGGKETGWAPTVLSVEAPKEVEDIEAVMAGMV